MPLTALQNVRMMSQELLQMHEAFSKQPRESITAMDPSGNIIMAVLEQTLDSTNEINMVKEKPLKNLNENITYIDETVMHQAEEKEEPIEEVGIPQDNTDVNSDIKTTGGTNDNKPDENADVDLFDVLVDISEPQSDDPPDDDDEKRRSLVLPGDWDSRRGSRWSATVLFLASEVQMMVNLAHLSPPEGFHIAPPKVSVFFCVCACVIECMRACRRLLISFVRSLNLSLT